MFKLNEQVVGKPEKMTEKGLPSGVVARVTYPIMRCGVKNANNGICLGIWSIPTVFKCN
jgi:hypothetical protein